MARSDGCGFVWSRNSPGFRAKPSYAASVETDATVPFPLAAFFHLPHAGGDRSRCALHRCRAAVFEPRSVRCRSSPAAVDHRVSCSGSSTECRCVAGRPAMCRRGAGRIFLGCQCVAGTYVPRGADQVRAVCDRRSVDRFGDAGLTAFCSLHGGCSDVGFVTLEKRVDRR